MRTFIFITVALLCNYCTGSHTSAYGRRDPKSFYIYFGGGFSHIDRIRDDTVTFVLNGVELLQKQIMISDISAGFVFDFQYRIKNDTVYKKALDQEVVVAIIPKLPYLDIKVRKNRVESRTQVNTKKGHILVINNHNIRHPNGVVEPTIAFHQSHEGTKNEFN